MLTFVLISSFSGPLSADMGRIRISDAKISETSQKAIILHNFNEEVLILGTDLNADKPTGLIRFIPFPSEPKVQLASPNAFESAKKLVHEHQLKKLFFTKSSTHVNNVEITFSEQLGVHDISVIKINSTADFTQWLTNFLASKKIKSENDFEDIAKIAADYTARGINWFVFDFVNIDSVTKMIDPIEYRFKSNQLYYPLKTTNSFGGIGNIDLITISPCTPVTALAPGCFGLFNMQATTSSELRTDELTGIIQDASQFFGKQRLFLQMAQFRGDYSFSSDILYDLSKGVSHAVWIEEETPGIVYSRLHEETAYQPISFDTYQPKDQSYSVKIPTGWQKSESDDMLIDKTHRLYLFNEDKTILSISRISEPSKTAERYLFDLQHPHFKPPFEDYGKTETIPVNGQKAIRIDIKTQRSPLLGSQDSAIDVVKRYAIFPQQEGFTVITMETPLSIAQKHETLFDQVVKSLTLKGNVTKKVAPAITDAEYKVFEGFFSTALKEHANYPPYFEYMLEARSVYEITSAADAKNKTMPKLFKDILGNDAKVIYESYLKNNRIEYRITDRILVPDFSIYTEETYRKEKERHGLSRTPGMFGPGTYISRVGFNAAQNRAIFYISGNAAPITAYFVIMKKTDGQWKYEDAVLDKMLIP